VDDKLSLVAINSKLNNIANSSINMFPLHAIRVHYATFTFHPAEYQLLVCVDAHLTIVHIVIRRKKRGLEKM